MKTNEKLEDALATIVVVLIIIVTVLVVFYCGMQYEKTQRLEQLRTEIEGGRS